MSVMYAIAGAATAGLLVAHPAVAQAPQIPAARPAPLAQAAYALQYDGHLVVRPDRTAVDTFTRRITILAPSAIQTVSQQQLAFVEDRETLEIVEAFTEKANGSKVPVPAANILTRDAASGLPATFMRDLKQETIIFPDVQVGDTLVMTLVKKTQQGLFPGQFFYTDIFPRSLPYSSARVTVDAPTDLELKVRTVGTDLTDQIDEIGAIRRHTVTLRPQSYLPEEVRAVAQIDRDPALLVSTFTSYKEMGLAYAAAALPKAARTPEIVTLADAITEGIDDRRKQAVAIDAWMKKNIRYVAVLLGLSRVVPNDATTVLRNKYGDCKDKATLMSALLAAKGIASEQVLINFGPAYTLPEPPNMAVLNHVILYLPEFDVYDDPTASFASFGTLAVETYDKPIVRIGPDGAILTRTPAMRPQDHTASAKTTLRIAADGKVTGQTEESNTGVFGTALRSAVANIQNLGSDAAARRLLQVFNTPGSGSHDFGNTAENAAPVTMTGSFALNQPFKPPAGQRAAISFGMPQTARPGNFLLGTRLAGRNTAFTCYAGRQTEDIEATFDPALPMPVPLAPRDIENPAFNFHATFKVEGRTLKVHREFVSRVAAQVCPPDLEGRIAADMDAVRINVISGYVFQQAAPETLERARTVASDQKLRLDFLYTLNPDCTSMGFATVRILERPQHGTITVENGNGYTGFPQNNPRYECNKSQSEGVVLNYEPEAGFVGTDSINIDAIYPSGSSQKRHYAIHVGELDAPPTLERARAVASDQRLRLDFLFDLNPDCTSMGSATVHVTEPPKHGRITVENGTGFPTFPQNNQRFACNKSRSDGVVIVYEPEAGFVGTDSVNLDAIYPQGTAQKRHYTIEVK